MEKLELNEEKLKELESRLKEGKAKLDSFVREYPATSVVIAFFLGYLLSKKMNSRG